MKSHKFRLRSQPKNVKLKVAVLCGGPSLEHEVSLASGWNVLNALDRIKFKPELIVWGKDHTPPLTVSEFKRFDLVFIVMHGPFGEDGTVQAFLELLGIPYTGSGVVASRLGMDKVASKLLFRTANIPTPDYQVTRKVEQGIKILKMIGLPCVVKPSSQGSSIGVAIVRRKKDFKRAFDTAIKFDRRVIVERYIKGREINCGILGNKNPFALPLIEIIPEKEFFDYQAKYDPALAKEITPVLLEGEITRRMQKLAVRAYQILGCRGFARVDMFLEEGGRIYVSEVNTIPGLTENSLLPKEARATGITFPQLLEIIINYALEKDEG